MALGLTSASLRNCGSMNPGLSSTAGLAGGDAFGFRLSKRPLPSVVAALPATTQSMAATAGSQPARLELRSYQDRRGWSQARRSDQVVRGGGARRRYEGHGLCADDQIPQPGQCPAQAGKGMIMGAPAGSSNATPLVPSSAGREDTYPRGQHVYMLDHVELDASGKCIGIVLRDPGGAYREIRLCAPLLLHWRRSDGGTSSYLPRRLSASHADPAHHQDNAGKQGR